MLYFSASESRGSAASPRKGSRIATGQSEIPPRVSSARPQAPPPARKEPLPLKGANGGPPGGRERENLKAWSCPERKSPEFRGAVSQGALRSCGGQC